MARDLRYGSCTRDERDLGSVAEEIFSGAQESPVAGAEAGFFGVGTIEEVGGSGGTLRDVAVLVEAAGATAAATSLAETAVVLAPILHAYDGDRDLLRRLAGAEVQAVLPVSSPWQVAGTGESLTFEHTFLGGGPAPVVAVPWLRDGTEAILVLDPDTPGLSVTRVPGMDPFRPTWQVRADGVAAAGATQAAGAGLFAELMARRALAAALDAAGAARAALTTTLEYAEVREQFGRPIASFQAYKHRCADAYIELTLAQSVAFNAADRLADGDSLVALCAGRLATASATQVCGEAVQLHGAIGFTWEAGIHALLKRARLDELIGRGCLRTRELLIDLDMGADQRLKERAAG